MRLSCSPHILIAEDDEPTAEGLKCLFAGQGYQVSVTETVVDGLVLARSCRIDLLVSDLQLKDGTGIELMVRMRQLQPVRGILISGFPEEDYLDRSVRAGFECFMMKPICFDELSDKVACVLAQAHGEFLSFASGIGA